MASKYGRNQIPKELDETILDVISDLINNGGMIKLEDNKTSLPDKLKNPVQLGKEQK